MFRPLLMKKPKDVKVVIIGKEPYPFLDCWSDGFAYSVPKKLGKTEDGYTTYHTALQAKLFQELVSDIKMVPPKHGSLLKWARQGVFLWNLHLTGLKGVTNAHADWGWDSLTREILEIIALENPKAIFVPWGLPMYGRNSIDEIVLNTSLVYRGYGPDTLVASNWFGSKPFSKINLLLKSVGESPINWNINY